MSRWGLVVVVATATAAAPICTTVLATSTDPAMQWHCQGRGVARCSGTHIACSPAGPGKGLVIFLPGTYLQPSDYSDIIADFARHGFHSMGLFYPSGEGQNGCGASRQRNPTDLNCTARERFKVLTGADNGGTTNITAPDSIVSRAAKALAFLGGPWATYLDARTHTVRWADVIIAGHSNGADHAGFVGKNFNVSRALLFAGPNDSVDVPGADGYDHPAPWVYSNWTSQVAGETATPPQRQYGFGICGARNGLYQHPADGECFAWHRGWEAMALPGGWFKAETTAVLSDSTGALAGKHTICSSGSQHPHGSSGDGYNHMASAADCCLPRFPANGTTGLAGRILWTNVYLHMLTDPVDASPRAPVAASSPPPPAPVPPFVPHWEVLPNTNAAWGLVGGPKAVDLGNFTTVDGCWAACNTTGCKEFAYKIFGGQDDKSCFAVKAPDTVNPDIRGQPGATSGKFLSAAAPHDDDATSCHCVR